MKSTTKILTALVAVLVNTLIGSTLAIALGCPAGIGAITMNVIGFAMSFIPMPCGVRAGVYTEVWTGKIIERFTHAENDTFLDGVPDFSDKAENDVIHLVDVQGSPDVLIDNTTYPLEIQNLEDGDVAIKLSKFETKPTRVTDDELHALSYDKIATAKDLHGDVLGEKRLDKAIHAFAPVEDLAGTPVIMTTGVIVDGRHRLCRADIIALKSKADALKIPKKGRRLVLCNDHINDLLLEDKDFRATYTNHANGVITRMYGFDIYEYESCPLFTQEKKKKAFGAVPADGDYEASVFFYVKRMFKAKGTTKMYYSDAQTDPVNKQNLVSFTTRFIALPQKREKSCGAIVSKKATA